ncbi:unnamed protein product [Fusarium langsethiae]|nr:unnamed protein product [Fusarium langsethiae]
MSSETQPSNTINLSHQTPITSAEIMVDSDCVQSRDKGTTIYNKDDLTRQEKEALCDLLREWCTTRPNQIVTSALVQVFFARVFQAWNSENDCISLPVIPGKKKLAESAVPVGTFKHDLPITPQKPKSGENSHQKASRCAGARAWLSAHLQTEAYGLATLWRDSLGATVNGDHVRLDDGITMERAIAKACINWDQAEKARVQSYNTSLLIALARLRIVNFAKAGTEQRPVVPVDLCVNQRLMRCQLISDGFARIMEVMNNAGDALERANVGQADYLM